VYRLAEQPWLSAQHLQVVSDPTDIRDLVRHDQMVYGADRDLRIVADDARTTPLVAIERIERQSGSVSETWPSGGQRLLLVGCELAHFLFQLVEFFPEARRLEHERVGRLLPIRRIELGEIPRHTLLGLRAPAIDLPLCKNCDPD
jgi:hypothetical protein